MAVTRVVCRSDTKNRTITFFVRESFGDGYSRGAKLQDPKDEYDMAIRIFVDHLNRILRNDLPVIDETVEIGYDIVYESIDKPV